MEDRTQEVTDILIQELDFHVVEDGVVVSLDSKLKEDLDIDSLDAIEILLSMEDKYKVKIDNSFMNFEEIKTVRDLRDFIMSKIEG
jgi:acyl carrier protein